MTLSDIFNRFNKQLKDFNCSGPSTMLRPFCKDDMKFDGMHPEYVADQVRYFIDNYQFTDEEYRFIGLNKLGKNIKDELFKGFMTFLNKRFLLNFKYNFNVFNDSSLEMEEYRNSLGIIDDKHNFKRTHYKLFIVYSLYNIDTNKFDHYYKFVVDKIEPLELED